MHPESSREITRFFAGFHFTAGNHLSGKTSTYFVIIYENARNWRTPGKERGWSKASRTESRNSIGVEVKVERAMPTFIHHAALN